LAIYVAEEFSELAGNAIDILENRFWVRTSSRTYMEVQIFDLAVPIAGQGTIFSREFFYDTANELQRLVEVIDRLAGCLRLIDIPPFRFGRLPELVMDGKSARQLPSRGNNRRTYHERAMESVCV
jgi:hypothetical protein